MYWKLTIIWYNKVTKTIQYNEADGFYSFVNIGNTTSSVGCGFNLGNKFGMNRYFSSNLGFGGSTQITPYFTVGSEVSILDGITCSAGIIQGNVTKEINVSIGWGTLGAVYALATVSVALPVPGARAVAAGLIVIVLCVDLFN